MSEVNLLLAQNEKFNFAAVVFKNPSRFDQSIGIQKEYFYKTSEIYDVEDAVVVESAEGFNIAYITRIDVIDEIDISNSNIKWKWVIQKIDSKKLADYKLIEQKLTKMLNKSRGEAIRKEVTEHLEYTIGSKALEQARNLIRL